MPRPGPHPSQALLCVLVLAWACGSGEHDGDGGVIRRVKRARQLTFQPDDFAFVKLQVQEGERDGLFGTCIHVPLGDAFQRSYDCDIGVTLPIYCAQGEVAAR